jgi:hypothetical protein
MYADFAGEKSALVQNAMHFVNLTDSSPKIGVLN